MKAKKWPFFHLMVICFCIAHAAIITFPGNAKAESATTGTEQIILYTYHTHPPFLISKDKGLSYDLADYLTEKSGKRYLFNVKSMSRPRINKILAQNPKGVIPWVNPVWFKDVKEEKYLWTKEVLMEDSNAIIFRQDNKIIYEGPESLKGLTLGGLNGHVYQGIDDYIKQTGQLVRVNTENHIDNFRKLAKKRIDVTVMPRSGAAYYIKQEQLGDVLYISPKSHTSFQRRAIIMNNRQDIHAFLETTLKGMQDDPEWKNIMAAYE